MNRTCNSTLEDMRINPGDEVLILGPLDFHDLARIIAASCTLIAVVMSLFLVAMHANNYTQPREQRHIIRLLFMVPIYAISSFCQIQWYWHAIYFQVISDCYEAIAIASFFALFCHYVAPDLHLQKIFFREMRPIKPWVWPLNWFAACCGRQRGIWRTPASGLTWFNIIWIGIYHYCFIRVAMTVSAVVLQYFHLYCESSNNPVFGHIWIISFNALAVTVAMFCLIQFYVQLREPLAEHRVLLKIIAIKLVVFLSFWQASAISIGTSTLNIVHANSVVAWPDLKVGVPALLLCVEMACFAVLHLWAFPYKPYVVGAPASYYPNPDPDKPAPAILNEREPPGGGPLGLLAIVDALNLWDFVKAFGRGMRWLMCGVKRRKEDISYKLGADEPLDMASLSYDGPAKKYADLRPAPGFGAETPTTPQSRWHSQSPSPSPSGYATPSPRPVVRHDRYHAGEESAGLMDHAQPYLRPHSANGPPPSRPDAAADQQQPTPAQATIGTALWGPR